MNMEALLLLGGAFMVGLSVIIMGSVEAWRERQDRKRK